MTELELRHFSLRCGDFALEDISFTLSSGEIFVLLGETGSGKTLLLESIAGFYRGDGGGIFLNGVPVHSLAPSERGIGFVYQDYGLFPHMTVFENIAYGLKMRKCPPAEIRERVQELAQSLSLVPLLGRSCGALSGGERQRTALARALLLRPGLLLLDEPFSALDPATRSALQEELLRIHARDHCTILLVTHSFREAQRFGSRVGILLDGRLRALRSAERLFEPCEEAEVNRFLGISPQSGGKNSRKEEIL